LTVSVIMCTYNGRDYVAEQVRSIMTQSRLPAQLVVSDDDSTDDTVEIIRQTLQELVSENTAVGSIRVDFVHNSPALGVTRNFEAACAHATESLVALSDQDDVWPRTRLELMLDEFEKRPDLTLLHTDARLVDSQGMDLGLTLFKTLHLGADEIEKIHDGRAAEVLLRRNVVTGATTIFRKALLTVAEPFPASWLHDEWLAMCAAVAGRVDVLNVPLLSYRQHSANQVGARKLGFRHLVGRAIFPRTERNQRLLNRAQDLAQHPMLGTVSDDSRGEILGKLRHEVVRSSFPENRLRRFIPIAREIRSQRYGKYGLGLQDVIRDILQPV
jgi:glycosyltransferase involved in cell wall biosynthesis